MIIDKYKYIFFDFDGVLVSSVRYYALIFKKTAEKLGAPTDIPYIEYHKKVKSI